MAGDETRPKRDGRRAVLGVLTAVLLASCSTSDSDVPFGFDTVTPESIQGQSLQADPMQVAAAPSDATAAGTFVMDADDPQLPATVASAPSLRPGSALAADAMPAAETAADAQPTADPQLQTAAVVPVPQPAQDQTQQTAALAQQPVEEQGSTDTEPGQAQATQFIENSPAPLQVAALEPKKRGFLSSFFGTQARGAAPQVKRPLVGNSDVRPLVTPAAPMQAAAAPTPPAPIVQIASTQPGAGGANGQSALPGVRANALFEIKRRSGLDDDSDIDLHEDEESFEVASAAGLARLAPNGLMKQTEGVDVACLKPSLVRVLKTIERHYGRKIIVTSGYRNPERNRKARGARNSLHMYCAAADVQVEGISKWDLAAYVRTMPGRGGVGTYCHTNSVHVDVGPERDWNWRCRRRK